MFNMPFWNSGLTKHQRTVVRHLSRMENTPEGKMVEWLVELGIALTTVVGMGKSIADVANDMEVRRIGAHMAELWKAGE